MFIVFINSVVMYAVLIILMRLVGKRQLGELEISELLVTVLISQAATAPITDTEKSLLYGIIPAVTLLGLEYLLSMLSLKSVKFRALLSGKPSLLVVRGRIDQGEMRRNRFTLDELAEALRSQGILDFATVDFAILESDGKLNVIPTPENQPVTAGQLGVADSDGGYPVILINDRRVLENNLKLIGRDKAWLNETLKSHGLRSPQEVYMMTGNMDGEVYISPKEA